MRERERESDAVAANENIDLRRQRKSSCRAYMVPLTLSLTFVTVFQMFSSI